MWSLKHSLSENGLHEHLVPQQLKAAVQISQICPKAGLTEMEQICWADWDQTQRNSKARGLHTASKAAPNDSMGGKTLI